METRTGCYLCKKSYKDPRECRRHFKDKHPAEFVSPGFDYALTRNISVPSPSAPPVVAPVGTPVVAPAVAPVVTPVAAPVVASVVASLVHLLELVTMEETSGRGHREKIPSAKIKEQATKLLERTDVNPHSTSILPYYVATRDPRFENEQKEIQKIYDHTKIGPNGEKTDWYSLGAHVESKDKRFYIRAQRDPKTLYFHAAETPPFRARISDENHPQCAVDHLNSVFTKDMMGKSGEFGNFTSKANVCAREGQFFYEVKILSQAPADTPSVIVQNADRTATDRGAIRVGFCRRETPTGESLGSSAYSYAVVCRNGPGKAYGTVRFASYLHKVKGIDHDDLKVGDVMGLMITLPPLEVHKKVVQGTFNPADYPDLACGPGKPKAKSKGIKKKDKAAGKEKEKDVDAAKAKSNHDEEMKHRSLIRSALNEVARLNIPIDHDILRDRNPFIHKNGLVYFECPEYTNRPDLERPSKEMRQKSINPETGKVYDLMEDPHPQHELPHLRTLPGSKIEFWVNGKYHGIAWEHLLAFLPPASFIDNTRARTSIRADVDDGLLGYYPAITHTTGGAVECKFDGPWWYGYADGPSREPARAIGERYKEQIIEDFMADMVDEVYLERMHGGDPEWMFKEVVKDFKN